VRYDAAVRFNWGLGSPAANIGADFFSIRWTSNQWFDAGDYLFQAVVDDGVRVFVDNVAVVNAWQDGSARTVSGSRTLSDGWHTVRVEYYERTGQAQVDLSWQRQQFFPEWRGEYFNNSSLAGAPALVRNDVQVAFDWGLASPAPNIPVDNFSARWTRNFYFLTAGNYRFVVRVDDGARVLLDDVLIMNGWTDGPARDYVVERWYNAGWHKIEVQYYEHLGGALIFFNWTPVQPTPLPATVTPTRTPTRTPTAVPTRTATATPTATRPGTPTPTATGGGSEPSATPPLATPTRTATPSPTTEATATQTPTLTSPGSEPTATPTQEPFDTPTPTATRTATPTDEPTDTPTATRTATPTEEPTGTPTDEPTPTPTATRTATPTDEPTETPTATPTEEPPSEPTLTPTATDEPTSTATPTITPSLTRPTRTPVPPKPTVPVIRPSITISPTVGSIGTRITVTGTNWTPRDRIFITIMAPDADRSEQPRVLARVRADRLGRFTAEFTVPRDATLMNQPAVRVVATNSTGRMTASARLTLRWPDSDDATPPGQIDPPDEGVPPDEQDGPASRRLQRPNRA
jgi:hypothetical protein